jgi:hypothetical protein
MGVDVEAVHAERFDEVLDSLAGLDGVGEDDDFGAHWQLLQVADQHHHSLQVAVSEDDALDEFRRQEEQRTEINYLWLFRELYSGE